MDSSLTGGSVPTFVTTVVTSRQIRAVRGLLGWSADELLSWIARLLFNRRDCASGKPCRKSKVGLRVRAVLETNRVEFLPQEGVRVRHPAISDDDAPDANRSLLAPLFERATRHSEPERITDFSDLRQILSKSITQDAYCRSPIYFAFTGRGNVWTVKCNNGYLILLPHPNIRNTLLAFFPFVSSASELTEQIEQLSNFSSFLTKYNEVLLARIPETIANEVLAGMNCAKAEVQHVDENKLDWVYPSYDVSVESLLTPQSAKLRIYGQKIRTFRKQGIEVITVKELAPRELRMAVARINISWIRTKLKSGTSFLDRGITTAELMAPYRALARLSEEMTSDIDGIFLKRENVYIAFSFWEKLRNWDTAPCFAAMTSSYEPGLSEYLHRCIAERVGDWYQYMCIGGSETASLDQFKRKFAPVRTYSLRTIRLRLRPTG
jgi:hypothetical protein